MPFLNSFTPTSFEPAFPPFSINLYFHPFCYHHLLHHVSHQYKTSFTTIHIIEVMMEENQWSTSATDGGSSPPSFASSSEINLTEQDQEQIVAQDDPNSSPPSASTVISSSTLLLDNIATAEHNYSMEQFMAYEEELYLDIDTALEADFMPASIARTKDFIHNVDDILKHE